MSKVPDASNRIHARWFSLAVAAIIAVVVFVYYAPFLNNFFDYDDFRYVENMYKGFLDILLGYGSFRIVSNLAWWPIFHFFAFDPVGYNVFSFAMLFADALLLYFLSKKLLSDSVSAALTAILFVGGSVGADAVLWKCTNSTLMCFFFYILSLLAYLRWRQGGDLPFALASLAAFIFAILSKEEAASLPGVIILLEFLILGERGVIAIAKRVAPYCVIITLYIVGSREFFTLVGRDPEPSKFFKLRPLHTVLSPWSVFSLSPEGLYDFSSILLYLIPITLLIMLFFLPRRRELCFAFGWIFLTFVPQSFTSLGQFVPKYLFNSMSRYLFLPSAGAALALAVVLVGIGSRWGRKVGATVAVIVIGLYFNVHYSRVHERGSVWGNDAEPVRTFLREMKIVIPQFPPHSYVAVLDAPTGRAYVQQSLRASYQNPDITWIVDPLKYHPKNGENAYLIRCLWREDNLKIQVFDFESGMKQLQIR